MSIESTILTWMNEVTGLDVWQAPIDTALDKPDGQYATFQLLAINVSDYNRLESEVKDADFIAKSTKNNATILISFNVFGEYGYTLINRLNAAGDFWRYRNILKDGGLTISRLGNPQNLTGLGDTNFVERWQSDIEFRYTIENVDDWDRIKSIQLAGRFLKTDGSGIIDSLIKWPIV
jgi:hypothetical protein